MYVCMYVCICMCICVYLFVHVCMCICMCVHMCVYMCVCISVYVCMCLCVYACLCISVCVHLCVSVCVHVIYMYLLENYITDTLYCNMSTLLSQNSCQYDRKRSSECVAIQSKTLRLCWTMLSYVNCPWNVFHRKLPFLSPYSGTLFRSPPLTLRVAAEPLSLKHSLHIPSLQLLQLHMQCTTLPTSLFCSAEISNNAPFLPWGLSPMSGQNDIPGFCSEKPRKWWVAKPLSFPVSTHLNP